jgi:hypothetical protein
MAFLSKYGNFSNWQGKYSDTLAFTLSTDPEHMLEYAASAFKISGVITSNRTVNLSQIEKDTTTSILAYSKIYNQFTGKEFFIPCSEDSLARKLTNVQPKKDLDTNVYKNLYDPMIEAYSKNAIDFINSELKKHGEIFLFPYMMTEGLADLPNLVNGNLQIISPELEVVNHLKDKTKMYELMNSRGINVVEGSVVNGSQEAYDYFLQNSNKWKNGAFISMEGGASGVGCLHALDSNQILDRFQEEHTTGRLIVQKWMDNIICAPNVLVYVGNDDAQVLVITDQIIKNGTIYYGNTFPSIISGNLKEKIESEAKRVALIMGELGYKGVGGIDFIVADNKPYFVEINPRKNHSTVLNNSLLEEVRPLGIPPLPYLEVELIKEGRNKYVDFKKWKSNLDKSNLTFDMFLYKKEGWHVATANPNTSSLKDHEWDFTKPYVANIPERDTIISKTYGSLKSEGHTRRVNPTELGRIVSKNMYDRLKQIKKMNCSFRRCV